MDLSKIIENIKPLEVLNFKDIDILSDTKNNIRYLNYFSAIQKSPLISLDIKECSV